MRKKRFKMKPGLCVVFGFFLGMLHVEAACNLADGTEVTVNITAPTSAGPWRLTMDAVSANLAQLTAASSGGDNTKLNWTLGALDSLADQNSGLTVNIKTPDSWPVSYNDSFWGIHTISLWYDAPVAQAGDSECIDRRFPKIYYDPTKSINGNPAWFHYWKQVVSLELIKSISYSGSSSQFQAYTWYGETVVFSSAAGSPPDIHKFAQTVEHEKEHLRIEEFFWGPHAVNYDETLDLDGDWYPDLWEDTNSVAVAYLFDSNNPQDAYNHANPNAAGTRHQEDLCAAAEAALDVSVFDSKDWSKEGKQW